MQTENLNLDEVINKKIFMSPYNLCLYHVNFVGIKNRKTSTIFCLINLK
jgi:hypothetical protein